MGKTAMLTSRITPETSDRLQRLAKITQRSKSHLTEQALEQYLDLNEWQISGINAAIHDADKNDASFIDHDQVMQQWVAKREN
ncbi:MAG: CopG family transcriptional regulator [Desulfuromusa sp.]|nr:CopG family transcriptional regulator [Desulfuromusa sp.]